MTDSNINLLKHTDKYYRVLEYFTTSLSHGFINTISHPIRIASSAVSIIDGKRRRPDRVMKPLVKIPVDLVTDF